MGQYEVFWEATEGSDQNMHLSLALLPCLLGSDVGSLWSQGLEGISVSIEYRMWTRMYSSTCICWAPMLDHYGCKD